MEAQFFHQIKEWTLPVTLVALIISAWKALVEMQRGREQRATELLWKQINTAKELLNDIHTHDLAKNAVHMLDWCDGHADYDICPGTRKRISYEQVLAALKMNKMPPASDEDVYIRDCFDWFFYRVDRIQHYIDRGLIDLEDVRSVFLPYARELRKNAETFNSFLDFHEYRLARKFFDRYETEITPAPAIAEWNPEQARTTASA